MPSTRMLRECAWKKLYIDVSCFVYILFVTLLKST